MGEGDIGGTNFQLLMLKFWILVNLNSASKVESWFHQFPPSPLPDIGILDFSKFELSIKS